MSDPLQVSFDDLPDSDHPGDLLRHEATKQGVDPDFAARIMKQESGGNVRALSPKGAIGAMQLMPATAKRLGVNPHDPHQNIIGGVRELKRLGDKYGNDQTLMSIGYNAGEGRADKYKTGRHGLPKETQGYIKAVKPALEVKFDDLPDSESGSAPNEVRIDGLPDEGASALRTKDEAGFQDWYKERASRLNLNPNPDDPEHHYDYRAAFQAGAEPGADGHWPSQFKASDHPNRFIKQGNQILDTITGKVAKDQDYLNASLWLDRQTPLPASQTPNRAMQSTSSSSAVQPTKPAFKFRPEIEDTFNAARSTGDKAKMAEVGKELARHGYEVGEGDGGWTYFKRPSDFHPGAAASGARIKSVDRLRGFQRTGTQFPAVQQYQETVVETPEATRIAQDVASERPFKSKVVERPRSDELQITGSAQIPNAPLPGEQRAGNTNASKALAVPAEAKATERRNQEQAEYLRSLPPDQRRAKAIEIAAREPLGDEARQLAGFGERSGTEQVLRDVAMPGFGNLIPGSAEQIFQSTAGPLIGTAAETLSGIGEKAEQVAPYMGYDDYHSPLKKIGGDLSAATTHMRNMAPHNAATEFAGGLAGTLPLLVLPEGLAGMAVQSYLGSIGRGEDESTALKHAAVMVAGLKAGGIVGQTLERQVQGTITRYLARATGAATGLEAMSIGTGEPQTPGAIAQRIGTGAVFGVPGGQPDSEASRQTPGGTPATVGARDVSQGQSPSELVPELKGSIPARLQSLREQLGSRRAVLVPTDGEMPVSRGQLENEGFAVTKTPVGTFIHDVDPKNPQSVSRRAVRQMAGDGTYHELLGIIEAKSPAATEAVVARDESGNEIQAAMASPENVPAQAAEFAAQHPRAQVGVERPEEVIAGRLAANPQESTPAAPTPEERVAIQSRLSQMNAKEGGDFDVTMKEIRAAQARRDENALQQHYATFDKLQAEEAALKSRLAPIQADPIAKSSESVTPESSTNSNLDAKPEGYTFSSTQVNPARLNERILARVQNFKEGDNSQVGAVGGLLLDPHEAKQFRSIASVPIIVDPGLSRPAETRFPQLTEAQMKSGVPRAEIRVRPDATEEILYHEMVHADRGAKGRTITPDAQWPHPEEHRALMAGKFFAERAKSSSTEVPAEPEPGLHHSNYQSRDAGRFDGEPEYPKEDVRGAASRRASSYDKLVALRRGSEEGLYQTSKLSTEETDRVRAKFESLKKEAGGRSIKTAVDDYLRQGGLFGHELNAGQQELLRDMASPSRRAPVKAEQGALFESKPTVESRHEQSQLDKVEPRTRNFTQFAVERGYPDDNDVVDHSALSPSGTMSKRNQQFTLNKHRERAERNIKAHQEYETAIRRGEIIDPTGRITKQKLEAADARVKDAALQNAIANIDSHIQTIENLGSMSHLPSGKLKAAYQRTVDEYNRQKAALLRDARDETGGLFQSDKSDEHKLISNVIDDLVSEGVNTFKEAAQRFREEFGPAHEYADIFQDAWDEKSRGQKSEVRSRGKATFDSAIEESQPEKRETLTSAVIRNGRLKSTGFSGVGEKKALSIKEGGRLGLFSEKGQHPEDMMGMLEGEGWNFDGDLNKFVDALRDEAGGNPHYSDAGAVEAGSAEAEREWERQRHEEFAENSDHSIMARAFDNPDDKAHAPWLEAFDEIRNPRLEPHPEDIDYFKEASRDLGLSDETINRILESGSSARRENKVRSESISAATRKTSTVPTDAASFKQGLVDHFKYSDQAAEATTATVDAFLNTLEREGGGKKEDLYRQMWLTHGGTGEGLEQEALNQGPRGVTQFLKTGQAVIRALNNPNESTAAHEIHHAIAPMFMKLAGEGTSETLTRDMGHMARWMNLKGVDEFNALHEKYISGTLTDPNLKRYVAAQERGARGFERYLRTGKAPTPALEAAFAKFKEWLTDIYQTLKGSPIDFEPGRKQRGVWDRMLGGTGEIGRGGTSAKQEFIQRERAERGVVEIEREAKRGWAVDWNKDTWSPERTRKLAAELADRPNVINTEQETQLIKDKLVLQKRYNELEAQASKAMDEADFDGMDEVDKEMRGVEDALHNNDMALYRSGSELGRALNMRQMLAREDYSFERLVTRGTVKKGGYLSAEEKEAFRDLSKEHAKVQEELKLREATIEEQRKRISELERPDFQQGKINNWRQAGKARPKEVVLADMRSVEAQFAKLAGKDSRASSKMPPPTGAEVGESRGLFQSDRLDNESLTPELRGLVKQMARLAVEGGARTPEDVNAQVHGMVRQHFPEITPRETGDIWAEYGKKSVLSKGEIDVAMREMKRLQRDLSALDDIQSGEVPARSGLQRDKTSARHRALLRQINAGLRKLGWKADVDPDERWAAGQRALQTKLQNQVEDLDGQIATGEGPAERVKQMKRSYDDETVALMAERDLLKKHLNDPTVRNKEELKKQLAETERKLADGDLGRVDKNTYPREIYDDAEASQLRVQLKDAQKRLGDARRKPEQTAKLESDIAELDRRIKENDLSKPKVAARPVRFVDADIANLRGLRSTKQKQLQAMRSEEAGQERIRARISELQRQIRERDFTVAIRAEKTVTPATKALRAERDELNRVVSEMRGPREMTPDQRIEATERALEKSIERMKKGAASQSKTSDAWSARIGKMQKELAALREARKPEIALKAYKTRAQNQYDEYERQLREGDFPPPKKREPLVLDAEGNELKAKLGAIERKVQTRMAKIEWEQKRWYEKILPYTAAGVRFNVLSGTAVIGKIGSAVAQRMFLSPMENIAGEGWKHIAPKTAELAPRHGQGFVWEAQKEALKGFGRGVKESKQLLMTGETNLSLQHGSGHPQIPTKAGTVLSIPGRIHGVMKNPVYHAEYNLSLRLNLNWARLRGFVDADGNVTPEARAEAEARADEDGHEAILLGKSWLAKKIKSIEGYDDPYTTGKSIFRSFAPVRTVPANFLTQVVGEYGLGIPRGVLRLLKTNKPGMLEKMTPQEADKTFRLLNRGTIGLIGMALASATGASVFGGYWQRGEKEEEGKPHPGDMKIGDVIIPHTYLHSPPDELAQAFGTMRREFDEAAAQDQSRWRGGFSGGAAVLKGLGHQVPFLGQYTDVAEAFRSGKALENMLGQIVAGWVEPRLMIEAAGTADRQDEAGNVKHLPWQGSPVKRGPENFGDRLKVGIPWLRPTVPEKETKSSGSKAFQSGAGKSGGRSGAGRTGDPAYK